nr:MULTISPECIES: transglycosylase family protein [unclassified Mycolicibacterium]
MPGVARGIASRECPGKGYHGGLQFTASTWSAYGGDQYAPEAQRATREQQITVAERVLAGQGRGAWPGCGGPLAGATPREAPSAEPATEAASREADAGDGALVTATSDDVLHTVEMADAVVSPPAVQDFVADPPPELELLESNPVTEQPEQGAVPTPDA